MDTTAFVATLTSGLAIGLTIVLLRLMRQDRQRSEARVATLVSLASRPAAPPSFAFDHPPVKLAPRRRATEKDRATTSAADIEIFRDASAVLPAPAMPDLFEPAVPRTRNTLLYIGAGAIVMASVIALGFRWAVSSVSAPITETSASIGAPAATPVALPLALVSLRHEQSPDGTLVISGVVRNPVESIGRQKLFAAASLVDREGGLMATARAPLDFTTLAPGEESPFVVRIAGADGVARYRIGFRDAEGAAVAHIDRR